MPEVKFVHVYNQIQHKKYMIIYSNDQSTTEFQHSAFITGIPLLVMINI